ncbi:MAG: HAD family hydrolase [Candidatus Thorarchaeota archaeon]
MHEMLRAVVFDLDGTISVLTLPLEKMRQETKAHLVRRGLPPSILDPADGITSSLVKAKSYFLSVGASAEEWARISCEINEMLDGYERSAASEATLIDGSLEAVDRIRGLGLKTAILTNSGRNAVRIIMQRIPLHRHFDLICTRTESPSPKPFPGGILDVLSRLRVHPAEAIYVGDARIDAAAASRAGVTFWGVSTGETSSDTLVSCGAARVFRSLSEVADAVEAALMSEHKSSASP